MDDFENDRVKWLRSPPTLYERRSARGECPQCGKLKKKWQVYCGAACSAKAEAGAPIEPEMEEEKGK